MSKVYALFVGINKYVAVSPLNGCVEDISAIEKLFTTRIAPESLDLRVLRDAEATRSAIIDGFRTHLRRAQATDVALFYFCGHGSEEVCPREWERLEPSGMNQTIVPVDARTGDVFDIADKELSALIHEVASDGAHVVMIADSCHSGGNTRGVDDETGPAAGVARMTPAAEMRERTIEDYIDLARELYDPERILLHGPPQPRHVAIAACQGDELAKEFPLRPPRRGAFSVSFEEAVRALGPSATYVDLVNAVRMKVRDRAVEQVPNLFVSGGASGHDVFLGGHAGRADLTIDVDAAGRWWLSAGAIDGIPSPAQGSVTEVAIYQRGAFDDPTVTPTPIATAVVAEVLEDRARLNVNVMTAPLDAARQYIGAITRLGTPGLNLVIEAFPGAEDAAVRVGAHLAGSSPLFAVVDRAGTAPAVTVVVANDSVDVRGDDGTPLTGLRYALDDAGLHALAASCIHLARWYGLRDLAPAGSRLNGQVRIELVPVGAGEKTVPDHRRAHAASNGSVALQYEGEKGARVQCRLRNDSMERLYVVLLDLTDSFACSTLFADWIPEGGTGMAFGGKAFRMTIPEWRDASVRSTTDYFKVVAAISDFDPERWTLPALLGPPKVSATRDAGAVDEEEEAPVRTADGPDAFWGTSLLKVVTTR